MGCGCGKGRQGTAAVKDRKRASAGSAMITSQTTSTPVSSSYTDRYSNYLRDRERYRRGGS